MHGILHSTYTDWDISKQNDELLIEKKKQRVVQMRTF